MSPDGNPCLIHDGTASNGDQTRLPTGPAGVRQRLRYAAFRACYGGLRALRLEPLPAIFILGHMRCGSTLLLHILMTHPRIAGCGERNVVYHTVEDFDRLALRTRVEQRALFRRFRYTVDQINHSEYTPNEELLRHPRLRVLFLIREPAASIASIVTLTKTGSQPWTAERAADYYVQRLNALARHAATMPTQSHALALTFQDLLENTSATFAHLQAFLDLETGFSEQYDLQEFTGRRGDTSDNIRAGQIKRDRVKPQVEIPPCEIDRAWEAYRACRRTLERFRPESTG